MNVQPSLQKRAALRCPSCGRETTWHGNHHRPFCSLTCRLVDLGTWLDEGYRLPAVEESPVQDHADRPN